MRPALRWRRFGWVGWLVLGHGRSSFVIAQGSGRWAREGYFNLCPILIYRVEARLAYDPNLLIFRLSSLLCLGGTILYFLE
jgi:hypothetical protein